MSEIISKWSIEGHLWDYSIGNIEYFKLRGFKATLVPLGFPSCSLQHQQHDKKLQHGRFKHSNILEKNHNHRHHHHHHEQLQKLQKQTNFLNEIDILFYGKMNKHRLNILSILKNKYHLKVYHANHNQLVFNHHLEKIIKKSKIVLNLCYFGDQLKEWKMPRFIKPIILGKTLIISEHCGHDVEIDRWNKGIMFMNSTKDIAYTCKYYLLNSVARNKRIKKAQKILLNQQGEIEEILSKSLSELF
mmetsp:Transcript_17345/g.22519  ORF Transcript_17345/g.22519 Transcript_17345/m.22519 type:complete len:245 (-) Transcript_17345:8-742(-)